MCSVETLTQDRKSMCTPQTLLVCKALPPLTLFSVPNPYESYVSTDLSLLFQGLLQSTHHFLFACFVSLETLIALCFSSLLIPRLHFSLFDVIPYTFQLPFSSQTLFPYTSITSFLLLSVSLFSCFLHIKIHHSLSHAPRALGPHGQSCCVPCFSQFHGRCNFYLCLNVLLSAMGLAAASATLLFFVILFSSLKDISFRVPTYKNLLGRWLEPRWELQGINLGYQPYSLNF